MHSVCTKGVWLASWLPAHHLPGFAHGHQWTELAKSATRSLLAKATAGSSKKSTWQPWSKPYPLFMYSMWPCNIHKREPGLWWCAMAAIWLNRFDHRQHIILYSNRRSVCPAHVFKPLECIRMAVMIQNEFILSSYRVVIQHFYSLIMCHWIK